MKSLSDTTTRSGYFLGEESVRPAPYRDGHLHPTEDAANARWWLWPHLHSCDAPLVAVMWQWWWARAAHAVLPWQNQTILALSVWLIYLADRRVDIIRDPADDYGTARHTFSHRHRGVTRWMVPGLIATLMIATPLLLSPSEFLRGLALLALASLYFFMTHHIPRGRWMSVFPKEAAVGILFALGTITLVPLWNEHLAGTLTIGVGGFAILCFLNCALITRWEQTGRDLRDESSLLNAFPGLVSRLSFVCFALAVASLAWSMLTRSAGLLPLAASAALLGWLDRRSGFYSLNALRVLSDVVLLTPPVFAWFRS